MKILFFTLVDFESFSDRNIYCDLLNEFIDNEHEVFCISPVERRKKKKTHLIENGHLLKLRIGNIQKTNVIEKGVSTIRIESQFLSAIKKYFSHIKFDLLLYSTPPITFCKAIKFVKERDDAKTYLMLKDIFPQNAVDLGMLSKNGIKGLIYKYFRKKEKKLYSISDKIGCMSEANVRYILLHNDYIDKNKIDVLPNCIKVTDLSLNSTKKDEVRTKYNIPKDKKVFIYGGNLGKPQGIDFVIDCLKMQKDNQDAIFLIIGNGTEYHKIKNYVTESSQNNVKLMMAIERSEYDKLVAACDFGLIFLDYRFSIPNFPSRLLSYMQAGIPVIVGSDTTTDVGTVVQENGFGWSYHSNDTRNFNKIIQQCMECDNSEKGELAFSFLEKNYSVEKGYELMMKQIYGN